MGQRYYELKVMSGAAQATYFMVISTFLMSCVTQTVILAYGAFLVLNGALLVEGLIAFMLYRGDLQNWVSQLLDAYTSLVQGAGASTRVFDLLDRQPHLREVPSESDEMVRSGGSREGCLIDAPLVAGALIELSCVEFEYP